MCELLVWHLALWSSMLLFRFAAWARVCVTTSVLLRCAESCCVLL